MKIGRVDEADADLLDQAGGLLGRTVDIDTQGFENIRASRR